VYLKSRARSASIGRISWRVFVVTIAGLVEMVVLDLANKT